MKYAIIGVGGFGSELESYIKTEWNYVDIIKFVEDEYYNGEKDVYKISEFDHTKYKVIIAIADIKVRHRIINSLPKETQYWTFISKDAKIYNNVEIGEGSIICPSVIITTDIKIGKHSQLNLQTTIGHNTNVGDYFTTAPGVRISGNCNIGNNVYFGTNAIIVQKLNVCSNVVVGVNSTVLSSIKKSGTYFGTPAKRMKFE